MRTPISCVRSVTLTSMMFITPMPPTIKEIRAMAETSSVIVAVVFSTVCFTLSLLMVKKSLAPWRSVSISVIAASAALLDSPSFTRTVILRSTSVPNMRPITVV